ncbi:MAG: hypothetical protein Q4G30_00955 [Actinomycetaceae bacterium]|nr:hypothetical protein [Actinomycetaceae bacterium]
MSVDIERPTPESASPQENTGVSTQGAQGASTKRRLLIAAGWAFGVLLFLGLPTDVIPNPIFGREVPIRWWEYPVVALTVALTFAWFAIQAPPRPKDQGRLMGGVTLALFAVACPVCNKIVLLLLGFSGALGIWQPIQPYLAVIALAALGIALALRIHWAKTGCPGGSCDAQGCAAHTE